MPYISNYLILFLNRFIFLSFCLFGFLSLLSTELVNAQYLQRLLDALKQEGPPPISLDIANFMLETPDPFRPNKQFVMPPKLTENYLIRKFGNDLREKDYGDSASLWEFIKGWERRKELTDAYKELLKEPVPAEEEPGRVVDEPKKPSQEGSSLLSGGYTPVEKKRVIMVCSQKENSKDLNCFSSVVQKICKSETDTQNCKDVMNMGPHLPVTGPFVSPEGCQGETDKAENANSKRYFNPKDLKIKKDGGYEVGPGVNPTGKEPPPFYRRCPVTTSTTK